MSLMSRIARGLVSRSQPEPAKKPVPTSAPVAAPRAVSRAETRQRISAGVRRRLEPVVLAAAAVAAEKAAAAAELERRKAEVEASARWQSPCKAIDAATGLQCGLMKDHTVNHRHARGEFVRTATGPVHRAVDAAAWANPK